MERKFENGSAAFIVESNSTIREVKVLKFSGGFYTVRFADSSGGIKVRANRLFATKEEAADTLPASKQQRPQAKSPWDYS